MKTAILCEGTTDLLMIQFILQYKYKWRYSGFLENAETNRLIKRTLRKNKSVVEIENCRGIMKIPEKLREIKDLLELAARPEEMFDKVIVLIDHDTVSSNKEFIDKVNENLGTHFQEKDINVETKWIINNVIWGEKEIDIFIRCLPETQIGAIEKIMLEALATDEIECNLTYCATSNRLCENL